MRTQTRARRRKRKEAPRVGPFPAGSPEAVAVVRSFREQQLRLRDGAAEVDAMLAMLAKLQRPTKRSLI